MPRIGATLRQAGCSASAELDIRGDEPIVDPVAPEKAAPEATEAGTEEEWQEPWSGSSTWRRRWQQEDAEDSLASLPNLLQVTAAAATSPRLDKDSPELDRVTGPPVPTKGLEQEKPRRLTSDAFGGSQASTQATTFSPWTSSVASSAPPLVCQTRSGGSLRGDVANRPVTPMLLPCESDLSIGFDDSASMVMVRAQSVMVDRIRKERDEREMTRAFLEKHGFRGVGAKRKWLFGAVFFFPLHCAVKVNNAEMTRLLLRAGADPRQVDSQGRTPYQYAQCLDRGGSHDGVVAVLRAAER